jgi:hypothetical protein
MANAGKEGPILVFLGPTLRLDEAQAVLDAIYLQPVSQGDVILAAHAFRPRAMVLIDGQFEDRPAVRHKEILWAMAQGIVMIGAASMGALRAAELAPYGMIGVGLIYRWYRRWPLTAEDAVAVQSGPVELGFLPLTDALVDLQRTFSTLARRNMITSDEHDQLIALARGTNFRDRSLAALLRAGGFSSERISALRKEMTGQKRQDALLTLRKAPSLTAQRQGRDVDRAWVATNTFMRDLEASHIDIKLIRNY